MGAANSDSDNALDDGKGGKVEKDMKEKTKKILVCNNRFLSYHTFLDFKRGWKENFLTHELQFLTMDLSKYNLAFLEQFTYRKRWM